MRIGIDMLGNQSTSRNRGIGRYTRHLVGQLLARHPQHEYFLYVYEGLPGADDRWPGAPQLRTVSTPFADQDLRESAAQIAVENADRLDVLLQTTPLECFRGHVPPAKNVGGPKLASILYDLIPMLFQDLYLADPQYSRRYFQAVRHLRQYDLLLAISEASRLDGQRVLQLASEQVVTIGAASDGEFFFPDRSQPMPEASRAVLDRLGVREPFVYCLSGLDGRKNIRGLMQAFALLPEAIRRQNQLVVTCSMTAEEEVHWLGEARRFAIDEQLTLTNFLSDETIRVLYQRCAAFVFPSYYEGFGLPLLEALHCGAPVLAGRNSSQREVVGEAGLLADASSPAEIASQLARLLSDAELAATLRRRGPEQARTFSWEATADRAIAALEQVARDEIRPQRTLRRFAPKRRIAFFSPLPPKRSGIADYSQSLLEQLRRHYVIDLYHAPDYVPHLSLSSLDFACHDYRLFPRYHRALDYRGLLYQMGNSKYHGFVYQTLLKYPGVVALHDFALTGFHYWFSLQPEAAPDHFARQLARENPALAAEFLADRERWAAEPGGIPAASHCRGARLNQEVLQSAAGIVVHDPWVAGQIRLRHPELAAIVSVVPHGADVEPPSADRRAQLRRQYGIPDDALLFGCFGILHPSKCNVETVDAFAAIAARHPRALLAFVGRDLGGGEAQARVAALGLNERVRFFGHTPIDVFRELAAVSDIGVNLRRPPTNGETSGALVMLLGAGVPSVVIDVDTFASYPDDVVRKVPWSSALATQLVEAFGQLADSSQERTRIGRAAVAYVHSRHSWSRSAELYVEAIESAYRRRATGDAGRESCKERAA